jgi:DNA modification methylase
MTRREIIGDCVLYCGDALEILPTISADLIVTDPPYKLTSGGGTPRNGQQRMSGCFNSELYSNDGNIVECNIDWPDFMPLLYGVLKPGCHAYVMANNRHVQAMLNEAESSGFLFHNLLVWDKGTATPNRWYMKNLEFCGFFYKQRSKYIADCGAKQLIYVPQEDYAGHPTTKPVALMEHYIRNSSEIGDVVLDPFMGVGSAGVAAVRSGRKFVGIEIDQKWFDHACRRIEARLKAPQQAEMFA